jgi:t-SNARE complex subunit (syntaxin)
MERFSLSSGNFQSNHPSKNKDVQCPEGSSYKSIILYYIIIIIIIIIIIKLVHCIPTQTSDFISSSQE